MYSTKVIVCPYGILSIYKYVRRMAMARLWLRCFFAAVVITTIIFIYSFFNVPSVTELKFSDAKVFINNKLESLSFSALPKTSNQHYDFNQKCYTIHIAMVCAGYNSTNSLITVVKSIIFYRSNPLHFHFIVDEVSNRTLKVLFETWNLPQDIIHEDKVLVFDTDITVLTDISQLWDIFEKFSHNHTLALTENQSDWYVKVNEKIQRPWPAIGRGFNTGVMLMNLKLLRDRKFTDLWIDTSRKYLKEFYETSLADQDIINAVIKDNPSIIFTLECTWNVQLGDHTISDQCYEDAKQIRILHWNSPRKQDVKNKHARDFNQMHRVFLDMNGNLLQKRLFRCDKTNSALMIYKPNSCQKFTKSAALTYRTHLFIREYQYDNYLEKDIGLVTQCSADRIILLDELFKRWPGTISVAVYLTDAEVQSFLDFISGSDVLKNRKNIAYHIVYKDGEFYPINYLRNVAISQIPTPYIFQLDVDFLPPVDLYEKLMSYILKSNTSELEKKAFIIPAFETQRYRFTFPANKDELLKYLTYGVLYTFRYHVWTKGHAATNFSYWKTAVDPYEVSWEPDFEPYIVVSKSAPMYDERFIGFGWNKVSYITHLTALGYKYIVLPNVFIIHRPHAPSLDIGKFRTNPLYRRCLKKLKDQFVEELLEKYGDETLSRLKKLTKE
ncbi:LARGE xylosyl- and glucuronyltransferase 1-like isoform X2 [Chelonus insularis]|uniref:LARGE xylosyl- and glucuronyltransferase 1-like isoform X2 n=1 Tax=Chelonus insularis TaxID=460826 RepID=UPI00158A4449|nr:LARGE xylosyl- and glucuronyltransferase 1-like isoform X2 [Chelonus insularis]